MVKVNSLFKNEKPCFVSVATIALRDQLESDYNSIQVYNHHHFEGKWMFEQTFF